MLKSKQARSRNRACFISKSLFVKCYSVNSTLAMESKSILWALRLMSTFGEKKEPFDEQGIVRT
ncbi:hypothetical protein J22TS1_22340 [Siminovitchia terrae]|nr:hypothetical protein J22TS1_22340 [Siminovitchia terrae]